ncbi:hypothetical protein PPACK8108_LOCUS1117 [Phakopsora pachyrhizi]|uniref:Uncharacterized protein n=1 Tax=Phakopsora pachyrhizi TaxID=170000 RepID=A0AAV0AFN6_PHAPC|nr:hypothetical protein PPACK8108_LOCUS1117 [Phakopsora pachyrhizi]
MKEKPEIKLESKIDCKLSPRQAGQWGRQVQPGLSSALLGWVLGRWEAEQPVLGSALQGWVLGRWQQAGLAGQVGQVGHVSRLAGLARQVGQAGAVGLTGAAGARLGFAGLSPRQVGAAGARLGLGQWLVGREGRAGGVGRAAGARLGFAGLVLGRLGLCGAGQVGRPGQSGQWGRQGQPGLGSGAGQPGLGSGVGRGSRGSAWLGCWAGLLGRWLGRQGRAGAGLGPRQVARQAGQGWVLGRWLGRQGRAARAWLGFAGLGPRQVAGRAGQRGRQVQPGLSSALLGWVLGRWQSGVAGARLGFAGLGPRQVAGRAEGLALLGWVLGRWQVAGAWLGFAGLGPRQVAAGLAGQMGQVGHVGRLASLAGQFGQAGAAGAAGAWLGWVRGREGRAVGLGSALLGWVLGRWQGARACLGLAVAWLVGKGRADWLVLQNELEFDQIALLVTSSYYEDIEGDEGTALGSRRETSGAFALRGSRINIGVTEGRLRFRYIGATVTRIKILISAIDRGGGGIRLGVIGLAVAAAQVKQTLDPSTKTLANLGAFDRRVYSIDWVGVDGIKWFDDEPEGPGSADSAKDGLKRLLSLEDSGGSIGIKGDRGGRYIRLDRRREPSAEEELSPAGFGRWSRKGQEAGLERSAERLRGGDDDETPPAFR